MTCENYMKFKFQRLYTRLYWNSATCLFTRHCLAASALSRRVGVFAGQAAQPESPNYLLSGSLQERFADPCSVPCCLADKLPAKQTFLSEQSCYKGRPSLQPSISVSDSDFLFAG